jgi:TrpR-related protein YerC/YecD
MNKINWKTKENKQFIDAFLCLKNNDEASRFLRDLMTINEIQEFSNRLEAARLLDQAVRYNDIVAKTGLSSTTIARIAKWLKGPLGGYRLILEKLHHTHSLGSARKGLSLHS